jgi:uridine kinase
MRQWAGRATLVFGLLFAAVSPAAARRPAPRARTAAPTPFVIGIAGGSGSGKSTLARDLARRLGEGRVQVLSSDDFFRYDGPAFRRLLDERARAGDHAELKPEEFTDFDRLAASLRALRRGRTIVKNVYDHATQRILADHEHVAPRPIIVVEGLHTISAGALAPELDLTIYVDPSERVRYAWKQQRDLAERHMTPTEVRDSYEKEAAHFDAFIRPQRERADLVLTFDFAGRSPTGDASLSAQLARHDASPRRFETIEAGRAALAQAVVDALPAQAAAPGRTEPRPFRARPPDHRR